MLVIPTTIPDIVGARKCICDFMSDMMSAIKSFSLSSTLCISLMYLDTLSSACDAIFGPFLMLSVSTFIELTTIFEGKSFIAPYVGWKSASLKLSPIRIMFLLTVSKNAPDCVPFVTSATLPKAISAGSPSPSLFPSWKSDAANSSSNLFALSLIFMTFELLIL